MGCSFRLAARDCLCAPSHRQDNTYHDICYTSREEPTGTRNSSTGPQRGFDPMTHGTMSGRSTTELRLAPVLTNPLPNINITDDAINP